MIDLLPNNKTIQLTAVSDGKALGFGFAVPGGHGEAAQVQRWFLKTKKLTDLFPSREVRMELSHTVGWQHTDLPSFQAKVDADFLSDFHLYVKANCKRVTGVDMLSTTDLTAPPFLLPEPGGGTQADIGTAQIRDLGNIVGYVTTLPGDTVHKRREYWALFANYRMPGTPKSTGGTVENVLGAIQNETEFADLLNRKQWSTNCTLVIASCNYYGEELPTPR